MVRCGGGSVRTSALGVQVAFAIATLLRHSAPGVAVDHVLLERGEARGDVGVSLDDCHIRPAGVDGDVGRT